MKISLIAAVLCYSAIIIPSIAEAPPTGKKAEKPNANDISLEALNHVKSVFSTSASATDVKKATTAAATINTTTAKIVAIQAILKATPMPTTTEKKAFAQKMLQYEPQVIVIMKKMTHTNNTSSNEVKKIIQPAMTNFQTKIKATMDLIKIYYPKKEMLGYMNELKGK